MSASWIYSSSSTGQKIEGTVKVIVVPRYGVRTDNYSRKVIPDFMDRGIHNPNLSKRHFAIATLRNV
jgi:hypothetical protein